MKKLHDLPKIVIVGGGAGGFELAAKLGKKWGRHNKASIILVDASPTHLWKPLLHEVAAGTLNSYEDELNYMTYAGEHGFQFCLGSLKSLERQKKEITLDLILSDQPDEIIPERKLSYDILIIAIGSVANDFNIPGVKENCLFLDNRKQADYLHDHLLKKLLYLSCQKIADQAAFNIAVVGGGATGIELIAELHYAVRVMASYGLNILPSNVTFTLIEAGDKLLPILPQRLSKLILKELERLEVKIYLGERVKEVTQEGFFTQKDTFIPADLKVWAAGIKGPEVLKNLDGLTVNHSNQLLVKPTLQTTTDDAIFALGDCASCPQSENRVVPPRAQAAHQQANFLMKALQKYLDNKPLPDFSYRDHGSLISLSHYDTVGSFMGRIAKNIMLEGKLARYGYLSLYKQHQTAIYGLWRVIMLTLANMLSRRVRPRLKLH